MGTRVDQHKYDVKLCDCLIPDSRLSSWIEAKREGNKIAKLDKYYAKTTT